MGRPRRSGPAEILTLSGFLRIPLEGLVLIAVALVLPVIPRRILAVIAGLALTLVVVLKVLDYGSSRPSTGRSIRSGTRAQLGNGIATLRELVGRTEADLIIVGAVAGIVVLAVAPDSGDAAADQGRGR